MNLSLAKILDRVLGSRLGWCVGAWDRLGELVRPASRVDTVRHVLLIKFWGLGNWALLRPIVRDLRERWPGARFTIATLAGNEALTRDVCDELLLVRADRALHTLTDLARAVSRLRRAPPDLSLDFEQFARSGALLARLGGAAQRLGFRSGDAGRDGLYTVCVPFRDDAHASRSFRDLAEAAGLGRGPYVPGGLTSTPRGRHEVDALGVAASSSFVVLHPGSGDNFPGRRWSEAGFAALGRTAAAHGRRVVVTGGPNEKALADRIAGVIGDGAVSLADRLGVEGLTALLERADVLASNDTGPVHIASQVGTPVLAFYGPNTPVLYGPLSTGSRAFYRGLPCSPCLTVANYRSSRCRIHTCMASIPVGEVTMALARLLDRARVPARVEDAR